MKTKGKKGISLITLVITIIVIIILAAAVILTLNNNNPIENAKEATFKSDVKTVQSELTMYIAKQTADTLGVFKAEELNLSETTTPKIEEILTSIKSSGLKGKIEVQNGKLIYTGTIEKEEKWFKEIMGESVVTPPEETVTPGVPVADDTPYTTTNSDGGKDTAIIPQGFKVSEKEEEQTIETGLVVIAPDDSEFVWVPVPENELNLFAEEDGTNDENGNPNMRGKLWKFTKNGQNTGTEIQYSSTGYREPDIVTGDDNDTNNLNTINTILGISLKNATDLKNLMQKEYNEIYNSVKQYHGFYIGRYETGDLSKDKVVSKKGNEDIGYQNWYTMYAKEKKYATQLSGTKIKSNMIYGSQWDATMRWFTKSKDNNVATYPVNAQKGVNANFSVNKKPTGSVGSVNNIYDMAGNVLDWTAESYSSSKRVHRGYFCSPDSGGWYTGSRSNYLPTSYSDYCGSRVGLYL